MHPGFEKDYRYLLSTLIPRHVLSSERIEGILGALDSGARRDLLRESFLTMEELVKRGVMKRGSVDRKGNAVSIPYIREDRKAKYTLVMDEREWGELSGSRKESGGLVPSVLAGIISSLTLNDSGVSNTEKATEMLRLVDYISPGARAHLLILEESYIQGLRESRSIKQVPRQEVTNNPFYAAAFSGEKIHTIVRAGDIARGNSYFNMGRETETVILVPLSGSKVKYGLLQVNLAGREEPDNSGLFNIYMIGQGIVRLLDNNRHLEEMVSVDRLTRINNRNYYESQLPLEMERATRNRKSLGFLIMDIDDFKKFNDEYGHLTGDEVLKLVAATVRDHLRKIDLFFRFGGEEFIVLLPGAGKEAAHRTAERIRDVVSRTEIESDSGEKLHITITIGGCVYPADADNEKELFRKADDMLLKAKNEGKNRVKFYKSED